MKNKKRRNFLCGVLCGAGIIYWHAFYGQESVDFVLNWLQAESNRYQVENPPPKVDSGWHK